MRDLHWTPTALRDLEAAADYLHQRVPEQAADQFERLVHAAEGLREQPGTGTDGPLEGTRKLPIPYSPLFILYRIQPGEVDILSVLHRRRRWY